MKKILFAIPFLLLCKFVDAQYYPTIQAYNWVSTRYGTPIEGIVSYPLHDDDYAATVDFLANGYPNAQILENPTSEYNCHGYAWHLAEGNTQKVWINDVDQSLGVNLSNYWSDGSFVRVCIESESDKAHYYVGDHSALTTSSVSGHYESKWGFSYRVTHAPTYAPYDIGQWRRNYYAKPAITGDTSNLCSGTRTFDARTFSDATYSWTCSSNITIVSGTDSSQVVVQRNGSARGMAWVELQVSTSCSSNPGIIRKYFPIGAPLSIIPTIQGCDGASRNWYLQADPVSYGTGSWNWSVTSGSGIVIYSPQFSGTLVGVTAGGSVSVAFTDICGASRNEGITVYNSGCYGYRLVASPNPAKGNINLGIIKEDAGTAIVESATNRPLTRIESKGKTIISLFEVNTNLMIKQWKQNESASPRYNLNISGLRKGVYVIQVDRDNTTMQTKIIVE